MDKEIEVSVLSKFYPTTPKADARSSNPHPETNIYFHRHQILILQWPWKLGPSAVLSPF